MLRPLTSHEARPITRASQPFAIRCAELELHRESAFAEGGVGGEVEALLELHLGFRRVVDLAELDRAAAGPGEREGHQLIEPTDLAFVQMLMEGVQKGRGLGFFDKGEAGEGAGEAGVDGGFVEGGELEFGQGDPRVSGRLVVDPMIETLLMFGIGRRPKRCSFSCFPCPISSIAAPASEASEPRWGCLCSKPWAGRMPSKAQRATSRRCGWGSCICRMA